MAKAAKIERTQKLFLKAMKEKFAADPQAMSTVYERKGLEQSPRKVEFMKAGKKAEMERGISMYDPKRCHCGGIPLGQRQLTSYEVSTTGVFVEGDDLHFVNNAAMQQMWDDIRRTIIVGLDLAHGTLQKRLGKEVTPETINEYLHVLNHAMPGAAVVQEHMVETHPALVDDCYVKVFTGDDEMADDLEPQFVLNLDKLFPAKMAAQTEGSSRQVDCGRQCTSPRPSAGPAMAEPPPGGLQCRSVCPSSVHTRCAQAKQQSLTSHSQQSTPVLSRWQTSCPPAVHVARTSQVASSSVTSATWSSQTASTPTTRYRASLEIVAAGTMLFDQIWLGSYMSGGVGFTQYATAAYTDNILDDYTSYGVDYIKKKHGGIGKAKCTQDVISDIATEVNLYGMEQYQEFPTALESHFGGSQRASVLAAASGISVGLATANSNAGLNGWYLSMLMHKEGWSRLGFFGYDLQDQCGSANCMSIRPDEGLLGELRGPNYPNYAMNVGHQGEYAAIAGSAHIARGDAWTLSPLMKITFADPSLKFDFSEVRREFAKGAIREFMPAGERSLIIPAR